jgi:hypothetical protein
MSAAALVAAGCGGGESATSTETGSGPQEWADGLCQAVAAWNSAVTSAGASLREDPTDEGLRSAAEEVQSATETLADELRGLGAPDTESGEQAKESVDELATQLDEGLGQIQSAVDGASGVSGALAAVSRISNILVTLGDEVSSTIQRLGQTAAQGDLADASRQADACSGLAGTTTGS